MKEDIKFSVLVPAFKARFLAECIDSILAQTYTNLELIIVNDASPENLDEIVSKYDDKRIQYYVNEKNFGAINVVDNWNKCLSYATGEYVICMGDDDKLMPCCLEEYRKLIEKYPGLGVYHGWTAIINEISEVIAIRESRPDFEDVASLVYFRLQGRHQYIGDFLFERKLLNMNNGFYFLPLAWGSDDISVMLAASKSGIANTRSIVFLYRDSSNTISNDGNTRLKAQMVLKYKKIIKEIVLKSWHTSQNDIIFKYLINNFDTLFKNKIIDAISKDIASNIFAFFYWHSQRKVTNVGLRRLFILSLKSCLHKL